MRRFITNSKVTVHLYFAQISHMHRSIYLLTLLLLISSTLFSQENTSLDILKTHLQKESASLGLTAEDLSDYSISSQYESPHTQVTHIYLQQQHAGIPVYNAILNANIGANGRIYSIGNRFVANLAQQVNTTQASISPAEAIVPVLQNFGPEGSYIPQLIKQEEQLYTYDHAELAVDPITVRPHYIISGDKSVRLVWTVQFYTLDAQHDWHVQVDATDGSILEYRDHVLHCEFGGCADGVNADHSGHVHHLDELVHQSTSATAAVPPNTYHVLPLFIESASHGERTLVTDPADQVASPFGWHDIDASPGPEYTITRGNNVHAYQDIYSNNQTIGDEPDGGEDLIFDFPFVDGAPPYSQRDAATVNLFYWNNLMHDIWYHYGFDEASGNFQETNYTEVGLDKDYVRAEALDGSGTNNANFGTPVDGSRPRMQMFLWGGVLPNLFSFNITAPMEQAGSYDFVQGGFGGIFNPNNPISGEVVLVDDGDGVTSDACQGIINGAELNGKIAMIDRGDCEFGFKSLAAQNAGAIMVIICNNVDGGPVGMGGGEVGNQVDIPAISVGLEDCNQIKMGLPNLEMEMEVLPIPDPGPNGLDSDFDNGVIAHEYGHGISIRLTGGPNNSGCLFGEQAGEGWSDWFGLVLSTTAEDNPNERRGIGTYVIEQPTTGGGIRPFPYSRDMVVNPITYADFDNVSNPHGIGSIFCSTLWDMYWNLVDIYGFDDDIYNGSGGNNMAMQLVIDGLKIQPCGANFLDSRDAIIQADEILYGGANVCMIWETFARRGMGIDALPDGIADFDTPRSCLPVLQVDKTANAEVFAGDRVTYELEIFNGNPDTIFDATIVDILPEGTTLVPGSSDCSVSVTDGVLTISLGDVESGAELSCSYQLQTDAEDFSVLYLEDNTEDLSANWVASNPLTADNWTEDVDPSYTANRAFFAADVDFSTDQYLTLNTPLAVSGESPGLIFWHSYDTEAAWDGGVVEISYDNGEFWDDIGFENFIENGYLLTPIRENEASAISERYAFHGNSNGMIRTVVDLTDYSGEEVLFRFRFATDGAVGGNGWYIDQINFYDNLKKITNIACASTDGEEICSEASTLIFANPSATVDILQDRPLDIVPNPTSGQVMISVPEAINEATQIRLLSIDGREMRRYNYDNFLNEQLDMSGMAKGVYLLQFRTSAGLTSRRIILQ